MSQVNNISVQAAIMDDKPDELKSSPDELKSSPENSSGPCTWRIHPPSKPPQSEPVEVHPQIESVEVPPKTEPVEVPVQKETNAILPVQAYHDIPEPILSIIEAKEPATQVCHMPEPIAADVQSSNILNKSSFSPVLDKSPSRGRPEISSPLQLLHFSGGGILDISPSRERPEMSLPLKPLNSSGGGMLTNMVQCHKHPNWSSFLWTFFCSYSGDVKFSPTISTFFTV